MRIAITGASGLVGTALVPFLRTQGHDVVRLVRQAPGAADAYRWDPDQGLDLDAMGPVDAVVHLAGENVAGGRWTDARKARIRDSRVGPTRALAHSIAQAAKPPAVFISVSAIGYYGNRGTEDLTERSAPGDGFLPGVCQAWEAAADPARHAGIRVVHPRFGIILDGRGGALGRMRTPFSLGLGGRLGPGTQYYSWVGIADVLAAVQFVLATDGISGPVNVTSPNPVTNADFTSTLGRVVRRPAVIPVPAWALTLAFGELAEAELLSSKRVLPAVLADAGFTFTHPDLEQALRATLDGPSAVPHA